MKNPRLFISYSWTSADHEAWVLRLATDLRDSGVDVVFDKWDLKEGQDANAFMERMVNDPEIRKVLLICDETYVEKANRRTSGVGTEAQIISSEIYTRAGQSKFVALVLKRDENGNAVVPTYYKSRVYVDCSDPSREPEAFEQLLRWAHDQPLHVKPEIGPIPSFLQDDAPRRLIATRVQFTRALDAVRHSRPNAGGLVGEYFSEFAGQLEKFRLVRTSQEFDDVVVASIEDFREPRNEVIELFSALGRFRPDADSPALVHRFFEQILVYTEHPDSATTWSEDDFDNYRFVAYELFLYAVAIFLKLERSPLVAHLLETEYYAPSHHGRGRTMDSYVRFLAPPKSLERRNQRLNLQRVSLVAELLKDRCVGLPVGFREIQQADFVLYLRGQAKPDVYWWPHTVVFGMSQFEIFARSRSARYFESVKRILGVENKDELAVVLERIRRDGAAPRWGRHSVFLLVGIDDIGTRV